MTTTPSRRAARWCAVLSLLGITLSAVLTVLHLGLMRGELLGGSVCRDEGLFNCHAVTGGAFGALLGMPLSLWGLLGYLVVLALALYALAAPDASEAAITLTVGLATLFVGADAFLFYVMAFVIRYYCLLCLLTYAVNLVLLVVAVRGSGASWPRALSRVPSSMAALVPSARHPAAWLWWGMVAASALAAVSVHAATAFVSRGSPGLIRQQVQEFIAKQTRVPIDTSADPRLGSASAPLQLVEFSDFLCPSCQRASKLNPIILASHRRDTAFIFKHFPLDMECNGQVSRTVHPGACRVAAASECAHDQGKFWAFHDLVFAAAPHYNVAQVDQDAAKLGLDVPRFRACLDSGKGMEAVRRDIADGGNAKVTSTPTYVLNGLPIAGGITPSLYEELVAALRESK